MSAEKLTWLNTMVLVGNTETRKNFVDPIDPYESVNDAEGRAWHYRPQLQGDESNHYTGPIPTEDVRRRLFFWKPVINSPYAVEYPVLSEDGVETKRLTVKGSQVIRAAGTFGPKDEGALFATFGKIWKEHTYDEWLIQNVEALIDDEAQIGTAGLLEGGGVAFVSIETPEYIETPEGVPFKPRILAVTSYNGSIASTYKGVVTVPLCDNTLRAGLSEGGLRLKIRHSSNSLGRIEEARKDLGISFKQMEDEFSAEVAHLTSKKMTKPAFGRFLDHPLIAPLTTDDGKEKDGAALTRILNKREILSGLWNEDPRVAPWKGTAFGAVQVMNTYSHHLQTVRRDASDPDRPLADVRAERNAMAMVSGEFDKLDATVARVALEVIR